MMSVLILYMSSGAYGLKTDFRFFHGRLDFMLRVFARELLTGSRRRNIHYIFFNV